VSLGSFLDTESACFVHVAQVRNDTVARTTLGPNRFNERPVIVTLAVFDDRNLAEKHATNIQHHTGRPQGGRFSLHGTLTNNRRRLVALADFQYKMTKNIFQLSNLG
jgi:hypothetical protein